MENSESGDDLGHNFLTADPSYIVQSDDMDGKYNNFITIISSLYKYNAKMKL